MIVIVLQLILLCLGFLFFFASASRLLSNLSTFAATHAMFLCLDTNLTMCSSEYGLLNPANVMITWELRYELSGEFIMLFIH